MAATAYRPAGGRRPRAQPARRYIEFLSVCVAICNTARQRETTTNTQCALAKGARFLHFLIRPYLAESFSSALMQFRLASPSRRASGGAARPANRLTNDRARRSPRAARSHRTDGRTDGQTPPTSRPAGRPAGKQTDRRTDGRALNLTPATHRPTRWPSASRQFNAIGGRRHRWRHLSPAGGRSGACRRRRRAATTTVRFR